MTLNPASQRWPQPTTYHQLNPAETPAIQRMSLQSQQLWPGNCLSCMGLNWSCLSKAWFVFSSCPRKWHLHISTARLQSHHNCFLLCSREVATSHFISNRAELQAMHLQSSSSFLLFQMSPVNLSSCVSPSLTYFTKIFVWLEATDSTSSFNPIPPQNDCRVEVLLKPWPRSALNQSSIPLAFNGDA